MTERETHLIEDVRGQQITETDYDIQENEDTLAAGLTIFEATAFLQGYLYAVGEQRQITATAHIYTPNQVAVFTVTSKDCQPV
jgi:hypothetical protein